MNIIEITNFQDPALDAYARLTEAQLLNKDHPEEGLFIAESPKVIERALNAGYEPVSFLVEKKHIEGEAKELLSRCPDIPVYTAEFEVLAELTGFHLTRGALCLMKRPALSPVTEITEGCRRVAVLENVMNPTNVGAIFRSAAALGMDAVLLTKGCSNPLYRRSLRVSMGTVFQIPWTFIDSVSEVQKLGFETAAMALTDRTVPIDDPALKKVPKLAVVLGNEGDGLLPETLAASDHIVKIPMFHEVDSLNVAAASAVAFFELAKKELP